MKNNLFLAALMLLGATAKAQNGAVTINNHSHCDINLVMIASDVDYTSASCSFTSRIFTILAGNSASFTDPCDLENNIGWLGWPTAPTAWSGSTPCGSGGYSSNFTWENIRLEYVHCDDCADPVGSRWNGPGSCVPTTGGYPTWHDACREIDWSSSGTPSEDVTIDVY